MDTATFVEFWAVSVLFVITPGVDWAYAIAAGLRPRSPLPAVAGLLAGHLTATAVVAAGVAAVVARSPLVLTIMTLAGAGYLVWLGVATLRHPSVPTASAERGSGTPAGDAARGFVISGLNPKVFLLFLALLPQFTDPAGPWPVAAQIVALGLVHVASCTVVYCAVAYGARWLLGTRPGAARAVSWFSGVAMIAIGAALLLEQLV